MKKIQDQMAANETLKSSCTLEPKRFVNDLGERVGFIATRDVEQDGVSSEGATRITRAWWRFRALGGAAGGPQPPASGRRCQGLLRVGLQAPGGARQQGSPAIPNAHVSHIPRTSQLSPPTSTPHTPSTYPPTHNHLPPAIPTSPHPHPHRTA
jgi:hypothetical protein